MQPPSGYNDMGPPMAKRMRHMDDMPAGGRGAGNMAGPMGGGGQLQQQQQQPNQQQQQKGPCWAVTIANDYCQNFVDTGERPQNFLMGKQVVLLLLHRASTVNRQCVSTPLLNCLQPQQSQHA